MTARARAFVAFGAYLCLLTQAVGLLHVLVVRHATCPDHGEMVHGGAPVAARAPQSSDSVLTEAAADTDETDEHCLYVATRRREMAGLASPPAASALRIELSIAAPVAVLPFRHAPCELLRLAPKTSPPVHAG